MLDIDGVLQITNDSRPPGYVAHPVYPWISYNPDHGNWLRQIHSQTDIYYISDWREQSHEQIGYHLDLPRLDWINTDKYLVGARSHPHCRALAITALFGDRPVVWLDDHIDKFAQATVDMRNSNAPTLIVETNSRIGLEHRQMQEVNSWLRTVIAS